LAARADERFCVLHDRAVPGSKANIDHLVVTQAGVFVIDTKRYQGRVERRQSGGLFNKQQRLYVDRRDQTKLVEAIRRQRDGVSTILAAAGLPKVRVRAWLCFSGADWPFLPSPLVFDDVRVVWAKGLVKWIDKAPLTAWTDVRATVEVLRTALPER
jgi:hypothetical protein